MVYLSMAFGNPYGDSDDIEFIYQLTEKLYHLGIKSISLSDIMGVATPRKIEKIYFKLTRQFGEIEFGIHLHINKDDWYDKIDAAYRNGCRIFDGVINGLGGCPMSGYEMLGNLPTGSIIDFANKHKLAMKIDQGFYENALRISNKILVES